MNTFVYILRVDGARPSVSNYFLVWVSCYPFKKDDIGLVVFSYQQKIKKKRKTHFHSLPATCVLSCSKKIKKKKTKTLNNGGVLTLIPFDFIRYL